MIVANDRFLFHRESVGDSAGKVVHIGVAIVVPFTPVIIGRRLLVIVVPINLSSHCYQLESESKSLSCSTFPILYTTFNITTSEENGSPGFAHAFPGTAIRR